MKNFSLLLTLCSLLLGAGGWAKGQPPLTLAVALRLDDKYNATVIPLIAGIAIAQKVFEEKFGRKVIVQRYPHDSTIENTLAVAQQIVKDGHKLVIGGENSNEAMVMARIFNKSRVVFITPTSSHPDVTMGKDYAFRICFSDDQVADQMADFLINKLGATQIGLVHNVSEPYTDFLSRRTTAKLKDNATLNFRSEKIISRQPTFKPIIERFKAAKVTHVVMFNYATDLVQFVDEAGKEAYFPVYIGSDGWGTNEKLYKDFNVDDAYQHRFVGYRNEYWNNELKTDLDQSFSRVHRQMFKKAPSSWAAVSFDAAWLALSVAAKVKDQNPELMVKALRELPGIDLVTAKNFRFGPHNTPAKAMHIYKISKEGIHYQGEFQ